jgi:HlyD family secretion protein
VKILLIVLLVFTAALIGVAFVAGPQMRDALSKFTPEPPRTEVRVEEPGEGTLVETIQAPGRIEPHTDVQIAAEVSARIVALPFDEGQDVRKGDVICRLDDKDVRALLISAEARRDGERYRLRSDQARLAGLQSNMTFARRELERIRSLHETGDVSLRDLDNAEERVQDLDTSIEATTHSISVAEALLAAAEADIERAQDGLENTVISSPMDGLITVLNVEVGEVVTGSTTNPGTVLMTIADLSRMVHNAEVAESDIAQVEIGQRAKLHINAYPDDVFSGTVRQIAWQRSGATESGFFVTEIEIDLQGRQIRSGLHANTDIEVETHEGVIVPRQAIVVREIDDLPDEIREDPLVDSTKSKVQVVYRCVDGKAVCTPVKAGASDLTHRLVEDGLEVGGDPVIVGPYKVLETIKHDELVTIEGADDDEDGAEDGEEPEAVADDADADGAPGGDDDEPAADTAPPSDAA